MAGRRNRLQLAARGRATDALGKPQSYSSSTQNGFLSCSHKAPAAVLTGVGCGDRSASRSHPDTQLHTRLPGSPATTPPQAEGERRRGRAPKPSPRFPWATFRPVATYCKVAGGPAELAGGWANNIAGCVPPVLRGQRTGQAPGSPAGPAAGRDPSLEGYWTGHWCWAITQPCSM